MPALRWTELLNRHPLEPAAVHPRLASAIDETVAWLGTDDALDGTRRDPYWPKWETPWWAMCVLWELGAADRIPSVAATTLSRAASARFLHFFPIEESELPPGIDPYREIVCHCALGTLGQLLLACGMDIDVELPWARPWMSRYQMADGGWNCDEAAYRQETPHSSVVSSVPAAELVLAAWGHTAEGRGLVDRAAGYLMQRRLNRASRPPHGEIRADWWIPCSPRMYEYDVLRGLEFLAAWARRTGSTIPEPAVSEAIGRLDAWFSSDDARPRDPTVDATTLRLGPDGAWTRGHRAGRFALLDACSRPEVAMPLLRSRWARTLEGLSTATA